MRECLINIAALRRVQHSLEPESEVRSRGRHHSQSALRVSQEARKRATADYFEESIGGLHEIFQGYQRKEKDQELHTFYVLNFLEEAINVQGKRINLVIPIDSLLKRGSRIKDTGLHGFELYTYSNYRVFLNDFPIIVVGCLDACQEFSLIALRFSKKGKLKAFSKYCRMDKTGLYGTGAGPHTRLYSV